jgi:osmoprotectant transport system ATP-binding protein
LGSPVISLKSVRKSFDGGKSFAVEDVSLDATEGEFVAIIGGSGSGKTTTLKMINRLVDPDAGEVLVETRAVSAVPAHELRRGIGYVIQGVGLFPHLTIAENIGVTPKLLNWPRETIDARVREMLDLVELPRDYARRYPSALSGGDEPFGALDPITRDSLGQSYRNLHERLNLTTVMITHDVQEALLMADRLAVMAEGRILAQGTPGELSRVANQHVRALLDMPRRQARRVRARLEDPANG